MMRSPAIALLPLLALSACTAGPNYRRPPAPLPPAWQAARTAPAPLPAERAWWHDLGDPALDALVARALVGNPDLGQALARVDQARARAGLVRAGQLPAGEVSGTLARTRQSLEAGLGQISRYVPSFDRMADAAQLGASARWEIDLAGGQRREREAALAGLAGAEAGTGAARLMVAGAVADSYIRLRVAERRLALLEERQQLVAERRAIMQARLREGEAGQAALDELDAASAGIAAAVPVLRSARDSLRNRVTILVGLPVGTDLPELHQAERFGLVGEGLVSALPEAPLAAAPAELLRRRPDLRVAESRAVAANAGIGQALAEFWPKLSLSALAGFDTTRIGTFGGDRSSVLTGALGLRWRILDFGRVQAQVAAARGSAREALEAWRGAVLQAGADVEDGFTLLAARRREATARADGLRASRSSFVQAGAMAREGEISRDALAERQLALLVAEDEAVAARGEAWLALIGAYRAIGG
ncbi:MAG TPA: TolC family protein [Novosphingobium sp.]